MDHYYYYHAWTSLLLVMWGVFLALVYKRMLRVQQYDEMIKRKKQEEKQRQGRLLVGAALFAVISPSVVVYLKTLQTPRRIHIPLRTTTHVNGYGYQ